MREELPKSKNQDLAHAIYQAAIEAGFDNCGIISLDDMKPYDRWLEKRMETVPESRSFYENIRMHTDIRKRFPWAKALVICTIWYGKYRYPEHLQDRYAKGFFLAQESNKSAEAYKLQQTFHRWLDEHEIRWNKGAIYGLRYAALQAGMGIIRTNNFFYDEKGSWLELEGYVIDRECQLYHNKNHLRPCPSNCNLCVKNCPTGSLSEPNTMNPFRCISYCTTFGRGVVPDGVEERTFGDWLIGCDRCQDICPFNRHDWKKGETFPGLEEVLPLLEPEVLLTTTDEELIN